jgi:long-chain acyl-CoA synthetase
MGFALADIVRRHAATRPDDEALVCEDTRLSWGRLDEHSSRVANALLAEGVRRGDRVGVLAKNTAEFFEVAFGAAKIGAVTAGLNWRLAAPELAQVLDDCAPSALFVDAEAAALVGDGVARLIRFGSAYDAWRDSADASDPGVPVSGSDLAYMLYSSGTTGVPKGVTITHENLSFSERMAGEGFRMGPDTVHLCPGPQFHIAGAGTGLMAMFFGARTIVLRELVPDRLLEIIERERVTHAFMVPAIIQLVIDSPALAARDISSLRQVSYGAAPMTEALLRRAIGALGCGFLGVYGLTETAGTVVTLDPQDHDPDGDRVGLLRSVGKPLPWIELKVADPATGGELGSGEVGEIWVRSGQNTPGYWRQPEVTGSVIDADGWLRTGDGAFRDQEGYVFLKDRIKDMIISGGENVYPAEVENALAEHPGVAEVAVIGVPHAKWGETVKAIVVLRPGESADEEGIRRFARERIAAYKCPTSVEFIAELPRNPSGKVLKKDLRLAFATEAVR